MKEFFEKIKNKLSEITASLKNNKGLLSDVLNKLKEVKAKVIPFTFSVVDKVTGFINDKFKTKIPK